MLAEIVVVVGIAAYTFWRKQRPREQGKEKTPGGKASRSALLVTELYQGLEAAHAGQGLPRPLATPPLRYAEELRRKNHPLGDDVHALTLAYLAVRFGGAPLDAVTKRTFASGVRAVKGYRGDARPEG